MNPTTNRSWPHPDASQPVGPALRFLAFAVAVVPFCGAALWYAIGVPLLPSDSTPSLVALAVPIVCAGLAVIARAGVRRRYPWWVTAFAMVGALVTALPWLFVTGFAAIAVFCPTFGKLCLG